MAESLAESGEAFSQRGILSACVFPGYVALHALSSLGERNGREGKHKKYPNQNLQRNERKTERFPDGGKSKDYNKANHNDALTDVLCSGAP